MKPIAFLFIIIISNCFSTFAQRVKDQRFYRDLSELKEYNNYRYGSGALIDTGFGISIYRNELFLEDRLIVFEKKSSTNNKAQYNIIDTILLKNIPNNIYIGIGDCRLNCKNDTEIVVLYEHEDDVEFFTKIKRAWRADRKLMKFVEIDINGIDYWNDSYGVD